MERDNPPTAVARGELYALVLQTFMLIATAIAAALLGVPHLRLYFRQPLGLALVMLVVAVVTLPMMRILIRRHYSQELSLRRSIEAIAITTLASALFSWVIQRIW